MMPFGADGGEGAMARQDLGVVGKGQKPGFDGLDDLARVAAGEIGAADAAGKKGIAGDDHLERREMKTNRTLGVPRCVQHVGRVTIETNAKAILEADVGGGHVGCRDTDPCCLLLHHFEKGEIVLVEQDGSAREVLQLECAADMVDVAVGDQDLLELESKVGEAAINPADFIAGIDDDGFGGVLVTKQGAIALQGADDERLENHDDILAAQSGGPVRRDEGWMGFCGLPPFRQK
jgi:hypothetical protein